MLLKYHWFFRSSLITLAFVAVLTMAVKFGEPTIIFTFLLLFLVGSAVTLNCKYYRIFQIAFCWLICFCTIQALFFFSEYHTLFDRGGDDTYFFKDWILAGYSDLDYAWGEYNPYKTFVIPSVYYFKFINFLSFDSLFSFHINLLNCFIGAFIPVVSYRISKHFLNAKFSQYATSFIVFYPFFNYHSVKIMRDVHVYLLFTVAILVLILKFRLVYKIILLVAILILIANVRKEALLYFLILIGGYSFFSTKKVSSKILIIGGVFISFILAYLYVNSIYGLDFASISRFSQLYDELREETDGGSSLATSLKNAGFLGKILSIPYIWLSPLPPPFIASFDIMSVMVGIGCLSWYYLFPRGVIYLSEISRFDTNLERKALALAILVTILVSSLFISYTSGDPRHVIVFFPIFVIFSFGYFQKRSLKYETSVNYLTTMIILLGIIGYVYLKFL